MPAVSGRGSRRRTIAEMNMVPFIDVMLVAKDETMKLRLDNKDSGTATMATLRQRVQSLQGGDDNTPVVISADRSVKYEIVVKTMDTLQRAGVQRVGLAVKTTGV
jgi:biopolymer transport protein TolR